MHGKRMKQAEQHQQQAEQSSTNSKQSRAAPTASRAAPTASRAEQHQQQAEQHQQSSSEAEQHKQPARGGARPRETKEQEERASSSRRRVQVRSRRRRSFRSARRGRRREEGPAARGARGGAGNAKHGGGSTIPRLNFSIPCKSLEMVFKYAANGDYTILEQLDKPNELLSSVWALAQAPSSLPFLSSPPGKSGEGKVSEFSKFLANQKEGLTSRSELEAFLGHKTPSKI